METSTTVQLYRQMSITLTFIAHCMEEKNRHNFCDRTARSWMPTRKNYAMLPATYTTKPTLSFQANTHGLEIANSPRSSSVGGFDAVNSKQAGHVSQGLEFFLVGTVIGFFHFDKRFRLMTLQRRKKFRSTPKVLSLQVNVNLNMPRPCTFFHVISNRSMIHTLRGRVDEYKFYMHNCHNFRLHSLFWRPISLIIWTSLQEYRIFFNSFQPLWLGRHLQNIFQPLLLSCDFQSPCVLAVFWQVPRWGHADRVWKRLSPFFSENRQIISKKVFLKKINLKI